MGLTPPGTPTLIPYAAFHRRQLSLGVVDDPGNVVVGGRRSIGWGDARTEMVDHLDTIDVEYWAGKRMKSGLIDVETEAEDEILQVGHERRVGCCRSASDGWFRRDIGPFEG
ncbi:hypothetical protein BJ165DRAFT_1410753 [Panaeolus papilionaceus]|nr:hypothetical protein BJ165DRAFT_1410753 [Panaeolus papilionaceus]